MSNGNPQIDVRTALKQGLARLRAADVPSFTLAAELLLLHVLGRERTSIYAYPEEEISSLHAKQYFELIARRVAGEPTQHLTGKQEFWGLEMEVTPDVLIPRPETEHVIEVALNRLAVHTLRGGRPQKNDGAGLQIADIGTGSGCIAIALAKELPRATIFASDVSRAALAVARRNAARHSVTDRIQFVECHLLDGFIDSDAVRAEVSVASQQSRHQSSSFDLVVSNPPYVGRREAPTLMREVRDHEPEIALYGGEEGCELYADLIAQSAAHLKPGGILVLELGQNSLPTVQPLLESPNWTNLEVTNDLAGIPRVLSAEKA